MSTAMADLVSRLQAAVPAMGGLPTDEQYRHAIMDAVEALNDRMSRRKITTLAIVSGAASYNLPADFVRMIRLDGLLSGDGVMISPEGIIPMNAPMHEETWTISNGQIIFYPTPGYSMTREMEYGAGHVLADEAYAEMGSAEARLALMHAQAMCLTWQANAAAAQAWSYQIGDERVSKEQLATGLREQAKDLERQFWAAVNERIGPVGMWG